MLEEFKYIHSGIEKKDRMMFYNNVLKEDNPALHFPSVQNKDGVQKKVASMPDDLTRAEWALSTLDDIKSNDYHLCTIKYWS